MGLRITLAFPVLFSVFGLLATAGASAKDSAADELSVAVATKLALPISKAEAATLAETLELAGKVDLDPMRSQHVHARYPGVVRDVFRSVGDRVRAGEALARVESSIGVQSFELASSVPGVVLARSIAAGQSIDSDVEAFIVADVSTLIARLVAYPRDLPRFNQGQPIHIRSADRSLTVAGAIAYVSPYLDEHSRTAYALVPIANGEGQWRVGQFVTGSIVVGRIEAPVAIARSALDPSDRSREIELFVRSGEVFKRRSVRIGRSDPNLVEILGGVVAGEDVIALPVAEVVARVIAGARNDD